MADYSTTATQANGQPAQIQSVDIANNQATAMTRQGTTITIDLRYGVGAVHVIPVPNEQWYCKRLNQNWALERKLPQNTDTLANIADNPVVGLTQIGSSGANDGPLLLDGSLIKADAPFQLFSGTLPSAATTPAGSLAYNGSQPVFNNGTAWIPLTGSQVLVSSATTLTLDTLHQIYVFTGSANTTWTLPAVAGNTGTRFYLENRGTASITLVPAGSDHIYHHASVSSVLIAPGGTYQIGDDGTYWIALNPVTVVDNQWWVANATDVTKLAQWDCSGITTGNTRTFTLPDTSGTLVTRSFAQTLTNKTIDYPSNIITNLPYDLSLVGFGAVSTRTTGTGDNPFGIKLQRACTLTSITFRCATADASGNLVVQLNRNGSLVTGTSTTIAAISQVSGATTTFSQACSAGDILTLNVTAVGTTPGMGLVADIKGSC